MHMENNLDTPYSVDLDGEVDMEKDGDDEEKEDEEDEDEEEQEDDNEAEDKNEDDGIEPQTIGQGEVVYTSADDVDTVVEEWLFVLHKGAQEMCQHTRRPHTPVPAPSATNPLDSGMNTNCWDSDPQCAGVVEASDAAKMSPGGANPARTWGSWKHLECWCKSAGAWWIEWWQ